MFNTCPSCGAGKMVKAGWQGRKKRRQMYLCVKCYRRTVNPIPLPAGLLEEGSCAECTPEKRARCNKIGLNQG